MGIRDYLRSWLDDALAPAAAFDKSSSGYVGPLVNIDGTPMATETTDIYGRVYGDATPLHGHWGESDGFSDADCGSDHGALGMDSWSNCGSSTSMDNWGGSSFGDW